MRVEGHSNADPVGECRGGVERAAQEANDRNVDGKASAVYAGIECVAGNDRIIAVFGGPEDLADDGWRFHHVMKAVQPARRAELHEHFAALEIIGEADVDGRAG